MRKVVPCLHHFSPVVARRPARFVARVGSRGDFDPQALSPPHAATPMPPRRPPSGAGLRFMGGRAPRRVSVPPPEALFLPFQMTAPNTTMNRRLFLKKSAASAAL